MPKISRHGGASIKFPAGSPGATLQARGKLGPYPAPDDEPPVEELTDEDGPDAHHDRDAIVGEPTDDDSPKDPQAPEKPRGNASRDAWVAYVEAVTAQKVPEDVTRSELIELYG